MEAIKIAALGGVKVKIVFPKKWDHAVVYFASKTYLQELVECGVSPDLIRFSVGIENVEDIIADIEQALAQI